MTSPNSENFEDSIRKLNELYEMLRGEVKEERTPGKTKSIFKGRQELKTEEKSSNEKISFQAILNLATHKGPPKKAELNISFINGKVGFRVSKKTLAIFKEEKAKTLMTATIPHPKFTSYLLKLSPSYISVILRDFALIAFLSHDIKKSLKQSTLSSQEWEVLNKNLDPPKIRFQKVGLMFGVYNRKPAWGTVLHSLVESEKTRYQTIIIYESPTGLPRVKFLNQKIPPGVHHALGDREPCIMSNNNWNKGNTVFTVIGRTIAWITAFEYWKKNKKWIGS